jgi:hypothetical protein
VTIISPFAKHQNSFAALLRAAWSWSQKLGSPKSKFKAQQRPPCARCALTASPCLAAAWWAVNPAFCTLFTLTRHSNVVLSHFCWQRECAWLITKWTFLIYFYLFYDIMLAWFKKNLPQRTALSLAIKDHEAFLLYQPKILVCSFSIWFENFLWKNRLLLDKLICPRYSEIKVLEFFYQNNFRNALILY